MRHFHASQRGNRVELHGWDEPIFYEIDGVELPPLSNHAFAAWHVLPLALFERFDYTIDGPVDSVTLASCRRLSRTWELWQPRQFREVRVEATADPPPAAVRPEELTLFSGGIDSIDMLTRKGRCDRPGHTLTVHGMDYAPENDAGFRALLAMGQPLLDHLNYRRIVVRSNAVRIARRFHSYGMVLAGHSFLLSGLFGSAVFAADCTWEQDLAIFPWGLNHVTDRQLVGRDFRLRPACDDLSRTEKVAALATDPLALRAASFCKDRSVRPANCGVCSKCVRTKVMFLATTGSVPEIFVTPGFNEQLLALFDIDNRIEATFLMDSYQHARSSGYLARIPGLEQWIERLRGW